LLFGVCRGDWVAGGIGEDGTMTLGRVKTIRRLRKKGSDALWVKEINQKTVESVTEEVLF